MNTALKSFLVSFLKFFPEFIYSFNVEETDIIGNKEIMNLKIFELKKEKGIKQIHQSTIHNIESFDERDQYSMCDLVQ